MSDRRNCHRFVVEPDRAQVTFVAGSARAQAYLADESANGMGLLVLRGLSFEVGRTVFVEVNDVVHECEVVRIVAEDLYQHIGVRRIREHFEIPLPILGKTQKWFKDSISTSNPLLFIGIVVGFSGMIIGALSFIGIGGSNKKLGEQAIHNVREAAPLTEAQIVAEKAQAAAKEAAEFLALQAEQQREQAAVLLTGTGDFSWNALVDQLGLSWNQQRQLLKLTEPRSLADAGLPPLRPHELRQKALGLLSVDQQRRINQLLVSGAF